MKRFRLLPALLLMAGLAGVAAALTGCSTACGATVKRAPFFKQSSTCSTNTGDAVLVNLTPKADTLAAGGSVLLKAVAVDINGANLSITSFTWTSSAPAVATVDNSGLVHAVSTGTATITAQTGSADGNTAIVVTAPAQLSGRVYNAVTSAGIAGALVTVSQYVSGGVGSTITTTTTAADGTYLTPSFATPGFIAITASAAGYVATTNFGTLTPTAGVLPVEPIPLVPSSSGQGTISGTVRDATTAVGLAGFAVQLFSGMGVTSGEVIASTVSSANGTFQMASVPAGTYTARLGSTYPLSGRAFPSATTSSLPIRTWSSRLLAAPTSASY
jgi:hypothetical protein